MEMKEVKKSAAESSVPLDDEDKVTSYALRFYRQLGSWL